MKKFKKVKIFVNIRHTPNLYLILQLSMNRLITDALQAARLLQKEVPNFQGCKLDRV